MENEQEINEIDAKIKSSIEATEQDKKKIKKYQLLRYFNNGENAVKEFRGIWE